MRRQAVCNLLTTLSYPPWTKGLDRTVYMTPDGEERIPFHDYIKPTGLSTDTPRDSATLWAFNRLPAELQLHILTMCSASTLFQLMRVSSKLRTEASKLFWAKENAYFWVEGQWLLDEGYPGQSFWDMAFLANVRNVEVEYSLTTNARIGERWDGTLEVKSHMIETFWATLKAKFPNAKKVILNHNQEIISLEEKPEPFPLPLQLLFRACPEDLESSVLFLEKTSQPTAKPWRTGTWQRSVSQRAERDGWDKSKPDKSRQTILMPPKQFKGPVGSYSELVYQLYHKIRLQRFGLWPLMVEALDRHHFDMGRNESFSCPFSSCTACFGQAGQWTSHAAKIHYYEWNNLVEFLPISSVGVELRERGQALEKKTRDVQEQFQKIKKLWNTGGSTIRDEIQRSWMEQLSSDAIWDTREKGENSVLWCEFTREMQPG
jgi:hypothetical protein